MRILHAPIPALYQPALMVKGLRSHNLEVDLMYHQEGFESMYFELPDQTILGTGDISSSGILFFLGALEKYDVFHLHSGYSPMFQSRKGKELKFLSKLGKVIVISRWGCCDGRTPSSWFAERGLCNICPVPRNCCNDALNDLRLEREDRYADVIINHEPDFSEFNHRAIFMHGFIDLEFWNPNMKVPAEFLYPESAPDEVRIIHAVGGANRGDVKGSAAVRSAVEELRAKGYVIGYREMQGVHFHDLRWHILQSDIVVDQLRYGSFGSFARESMALGKPVVSNVIDFQREYFVDLPIVQACTKSIASVLEDLINSPNDRIKIGRRSRIYAERELSHTVLSSQLLNIYEKALKRNRRDVA